MQITPRFLVLVLDGGEGGAAAQDPQTCCVFLAAASLLAWLLCESMCQGTGE